MKMFYDSASEKQQMSDANKTSDPERANIRSKVDISNESVYNISDLVNKLGELVGMKEGNNAQIETLRKANHVIDTERDAILYEIARRAECRRGGRNIVRIRGVLYQIDWTGPSIKFDKLDIPEICPEPKPEPIKHPDILWGDHDLSAHGG